MEGWCYLSRVHGNISRRCSVQTETTARLVLAGAVTGLILSLLVLMGLELSVPAPRHGGRRSVASETVGKGRP